MQKTDYNVWVPHVLGQVLPGPVPGPDPDGALRHHLGLAAQVLVAGRRRGEEGQAAPGHGGRHCLDTIDTGSGT